MGSLLAGTFASAGMFAFISGSPYVYIDYFGVPAQHYGWLFGLNPPLSLPHTAVWR
jgi:DHA1 family bicyclomycin/chloramphenicol resistance-like MFS transporter